MKLTEECEVTKTILNASIKALNNYFQMTKGWCWVRYTPEYWYTVAIAKALSTNTKYVVILENSVAEIREYANNGKRGSPLKDYRIKGRADIVLWNGDYLPEAILEIKKGWNWDKRKMGPDLDRITASLRETGKKSETKGSIKSGFFIFITDKCGKNRKDVRNKLNNCYSALQVQIGDYLKSKGSFKCVSDKKFCKYFDNDPFGGEIIKSQAGVFVFKITLVR